MRARWKVVPFPFGKRVSPPVRHPEAWGQCMDCLADLPRAVVMGLCRPCLVARWPQHKGPEEVAAPGPLRGIEVGASRPEDG